jgi:galactokinase
MRKVVAYAPGRVNLIGEHTDYNDGFVMPMAIGYGTQVEARERFDNRVTIQSDRFPREISTLRLNALESRSSRHWSEYVRGVLLELERAGVKLRGADMRVSSTVPMGAGLSSSAALLVSAAFAMLALAGEELDRVNVARLTQRAENLHSGARTGIMDQFVSANAVEGCALLLDTRTLAFQALPMPSSAEIVVCDTTVKHALAGGEYNRRREECEQAVTVLGSRYGLESLRDASVMHLLAAKEELGDVLFRRAMHVVTENTRVLAAKDALLREDCVAFGKAMNASHASLQRDFEVSCKELDTMTELARECEGVYGSRMTGGGFGGCTVTLVEAGKAHSFATTIRRRYARRMKVDPDVYVVRAAGGATVS